MNNKKGITALLLVIFVLVALIAIYFVYMLSQEQNMPLMRKDDTTMMQNTSTPPETEEVSDSTDIDTIEAELDATITGSPSDEIESMESDAQSL